MEEDGGMDGGMDGGPRPEGGGRSVLMEMRVDDCLYHGTLIPRRDTGRGGA